MTAKVQSAVRELSDHLDMCQECNEPTTFCREGNRLRLIVVELLRDTGGTS